MASRDRREGDDDANAERQRRASAHDRRRVGTSDPGTAGPSLLAAIGLRRNLRVGGGVGLATAALLYLPTLAAVEFSVGGPGGLYLGLAFVLAVTVAGLVTALLCAKAFLSPVLDGTAWLRRGATAGTLGGLGLVGLPVAAWLVERGTVAEGHLRALAALAVLATLVGTVAIHLATRDVRDAERAAPLVARRVLRAVSRERARRLLQRATYWVVVAGFALAAGNATGNVTPILETELGPVPSPFLATAFVALVAAVPFAATVDLADVLPPWQPRVLLAGALVGVVGVAWLVTLEGWELLVASTPAPAAAALAIVLVPAGLGWAIASFGLRSLATRGVRSAGTARDDRSPTDK